MYHPTILTDVPYEAAASNEETFGPMVIVEAVDTPEDAVAVGNRVGYGLTSATLSRDTYKALELVRVAVLAGHSVRVIQTPTSRRFVGSASFEAITGAPVLTSEFEDDPLHGADPGEPAPDHAPISHLALVENADLYLIAPASANTIAKLAGGAADNLVTTAALAATCPVAVAQAMNNRMYLNPATQANLRTLQERGVTVIPPGTGELASHGERGVGHASDVHSPMCWRAAVRQVRARACGVHAPPLKPRGNHAHILETDGRAGRIIQHLGRRSGGPGGDAGDDSPGPGGGQTGRQ